MCWSRAKMFSKCRATDKIRISQNDIGVGSCCTKPAEMWSSSEGPIFEIEQQALVKELSPWECFSFRSGECPSWRGDAGFRIPKAPRTCEVYCLCAYCSQLHKLLSSVSTVSPSFQLQGLSAQSSFCRVTVSALAFCHYWIEETFFLILVHMYGRK